MVYVGSMRQNSVKVKNVSEEGCHDKIQGNLVGYKKCHSAERHSNLMGMYFKN